MRRNRAWGVTWFAMALVVVLMLGWAIQAAAAAEEEPVGHPAGCNTCHVPHDAKGARLWPSQPGTQTQKGTVLSTISALCYSCHDGTYTPKGETFFENDGTSHPIDIKPSDRVKIPADYPLDREGKLTCTTCHNPHRTAKDKYLREGWGDGELCIACHVDK